MNYQTILYEKNGGIAKVTTNRPRYKNAQSRLMIEEMDHAFATANADDDVRVIILAAAGETFSSGHDIGTPEEREDMRRRPFPKGVRGEYALSRHLFLDTTLRWRDLDKPTIAQVQGMCIFGGWMFAAAMDLIVASEDAKFLPALMQYFSVPWDLPIRKAKEAIFVAGSLRRARLSASASSIWWSRANVSMRPLSRLPARSRRTIRSRSEWRSGPRILLRTRWASVTRFAMPTRTT